MCSGVGLLRAPPPPTPPPRALGGRSQWRLHVKHWRERTHGARTRTAPPALPSHYLPPSPCWFVALCTCTFTYLRCVPYFVGIHYWYPPHPFYSPVGRKDFGWVMNVSGEEKDTHTARRLFFVHTLPHIHIWVGVAPPLFIVSYFAFFFGGLDILFWSGLPGTRNTTRVHLISYHLCLISPPLWLPHSYTFCLHFYTRLHTQTHSW